MKKYILTSALIGAAIIAAINLFGAELQKGIDLTGQTSVTASQLNQLVDNAWPATNRGLVYISNSAPNTVTYPRYTNYIWVDISVLPFTLKTYQTGSWVSATLGANAVGTANIQDAAVTNPKLAANAVNSTNISDNAVIEAKIAAGSVTTTKIGTGAVQTDNILDSAVTTAKIADGQVTAAKLAPGAVTAAALGSQSVYGTNIVNGTLTSNLFALNAISRTNLQSESVATTNFVLGSARYVVNRMNVGNTAWEQVQPLYLFATNATYLATNTWTHNLPSTPHTVQGFYIVNSSVAGYSSGDRIPLSAMHGSGTGSLLSSALYSTSTQIGFAGQNTGSTYIPAKGTGVITTVATSSMDGQVYIVAIYYNQATEN